MNTNLLKPLLMTFILAIASMEAGAQNVTWSDSFTNGVAPTTAQINAWDAWRASLVPGQYTYMTIKGTFDKTGYTCTDKTIVNDFATAVKNYTTYISGTTGGHVWSICNRYLGEIWIDPLASCSGSNCPTVNGYIIRPGIGTANSNWGGVNSNTCGAPTQRMTFIFGKPSKPNEMGVASITAPNLCTYTQPISAKISNYGTNTVDSFRLYWTVNGVLQTPLYITSKLAKSKDTTIVVATAFNFLASTKYDLKFWTHRPNNFTDSIPSNDTLKYSFTFLGNPSLPTTTNFIQCGIGKPILKATPASPADSILWFTTSTGGSTIGMGKSLVGPKITTTSTFYAQALKLGGTTIVGPGYNGATAVTNNLSAYNGAMFDINVFNTTSLDSVTFNLTTANPTTNYRLYYKLGTHVGFETNASAWTLINSGQIRYFTTGGKFFARVSAKGLFLQGGQLYGLYYTTDPTTGGGNDILNATGAITTTSTDLSITGRLCMQGLFASVGFYQTYTGNMELMLKKQCTNPTRVPLTVIVKPRPTGADIARGSTFQGQFRVGDMSTPDITEAGKTIVYNILPPTGFSNAAYANSWVINNITARTRYGVLVPSTEYSTVDPSGSGPGTITFKPRSFYIDSFITFSINYSDLGPYFCDSTIKRTVVVGATPWPNFKFPSSICLGDAILLDNTTTIKTGNSSYMWYFGNGDSSDLQSPVYEFKLAGVYKVRLVAKSFPWNIIHDTTISLEVGELPTAKYRVNNKCQGLAVTFQNQTVVGNGVLTYDWDFGDGTPHSTATNPSHLYTTPGGYKVTMKATANGCVATLVKNAYMFARPVANFKTPLVPVCAKTEVLMPNTSTILLGTQGAYWNFGDGDGSTIFDGAHAYATAGTYSVKLLAISEFDCKDSITKSVSIKAAPSPDFITNQLCGKKPTTFTNKTVEDIANPVYNWTFSDNYTSAFKHVTRTWPFEGPYTATLKATYNNGCSGSITKDFKVLLQPKADFQMSDICSGESAEFVNLSEGDRGNIQYFWDFGNGTNSSEGTPTRLYNPSATVTYVVTLIASYAGGCSDTIRKNITVSESPVCDFNFKLLGFNNVKFTPSNTTYSKYEWFFGEGGTSTLMNPDYKYKYKGNFEVTMHATNQAGCTCEISKRVYAHIGINDVANTNGISIYPNPNNGNFSISNADDNKMEIEVFNVLGEKVYSSISESGTMDVNLGEHADGIYFIKVTINGLTSNFKITVTD